MNKIKAFPKNDLFLYPHTWTKGLDYEVIQNHDYFSLASNEGSTNITGNAVDRLNDEFVFVTGNK